MQAEGDVVPLPVDEEQAPPDFAAFLAEEHRGLFKALYFVTGNRADAAELMQDAFLKLWERWDRVDRVYQVPEWGSRFLVPGQLQRLWILDVDGVPLVIDASIQTGTSAEVRAELLQMVESVQIDPR